MTTTEIPLLPQIRRWDAGDGGRATPDVVLVHGTLDSSRSFRSAARRLADRSVVGYDRRTWGESREEATDDVTFLDHVDDLVGLLSDMARPVVAGHSYGGLIAMAAAARRPELVCAVVAYEPPVRWLPWWPETAPWETIVGDAVQRDGPAAAVAALRDELMGGTAPTNTESPAETEYKGRRLIAEMTDAELDLPFCEPTEFPRPLVVGAGQHSLPHHREISRRLAELVPHGRFVEIDRAGHTGHVTHPGEFAGLVTVAEDLADRSATIGTTNDEVSR